MSALIPVGTVPTLQQTPADYSGTLADVRGTLLDDLNRMDVSVTRANRFIQSAIARCSRELRIPEMERSVDLTQPEGQVSERVTLPSDFMEIRSVDADGVACYPVSYNTLMRLPLYPGRGSVYARDMGTLVFRPYIRQNVRIVYYGAFTQMAVDTDTTELLTISPEVLQYAALSYAGTFLRMDETADWEQRYQQERDNLNQKALDVDTLGQPSQVEPGFSYPAFG